MVYLSQCWTLLSQDSSEHIKQKIQFMLMPSSKATRPPKKSRQQYPCLTGRHMIPARPNPNCALEWCHPWSKETQHGFASYHHHSFLEQQSRINTFDQVWAILAQYVGFAQFNIIYRQGIQWSDMTMKPLGSILFQLWELLFLTLQQT